MRRWLPAILVGVVVGVAAAALVTRAMFGSDDPGALRALRGDGMARYVPTNAVRSLPEQATDGGTAMGNPSRARLQRGFVIPSTEGAASFRAALSAARRAGWTVREVNAAVEERRMAIGTSTSLPAGQILVTLESRSGEAEIGIGLSCLPE